LPQEKVKQLKRTFYKYDLNGDGVIDRHELYAIVRVLGIKKKISFWVVLLPPLTLYYYYSNSCFCFCFCFCCCC